MSKLRFHQRPFSFKLSLGFYFETSFQSFSSETSVFPLYQIIMDDESVNSLWNILKNAIQQILTNNHSTLCFPELYSVAYTLTQQRHGMMMYTSLTEIMTEHVITNVKQHVSVYCGDEFICKNRSKIQIQSQSSAYSLCVFPIR